MQWTLAMTLKTLLLRIPTRRTLILKTDLESVKTWHWSLSPFSAIALYEHFVRSSFGFYSQNPFKSKWLFISSATTLFNLSPPIISSLLASARSLRPAPPSRAQCKINMPREGGMKPSELPQWASGLQSGHSAQAMQEEWRSEHKN